MANLLVPVGAPPQRPPRFGLVAAAGAANDQGTPDGDRWPNGLVIDPEPSGTTGVQVHDQCSPTARTAAAFPADRQYVPPAVTTTVAASTFGNAGLAYARNRAQSLLERATSHAVEAEFWTGTAAQAASWPNGYLRKAAATTIVGTYVPAVSALAALQEGIGDRLLGDRGMIHTTHRVATVWQRYDLVRREGQFILDLYDNIVVVGSGYSGLGPGTDTTDVSGETEWAYGTGVVAVRLSPIVFDTVTAADGVDRANNTTAVSASRAFAADHNGLCQIAVHVDLCTATCQLGS